MNPYAQFGTVDYAREMLTKPTLDLGKVLSSPVLRISALADGMLMLAFAGIARALFLRDWHVLAICLLVLALIEATCSISCIVLLAGRSWQLHRIRLARERQWLS